MKLRLVTLTGEKMNTDVYEVIIPAVDGEISVFPDHEPLITVAKPGIVTVRYEKGHSDEYLEFFAISGGVVEINDQVELDRAHQLVDRHMVRLKVADLQRRKRKL